MRSLWTTITVAIYLVGLCTSTFGQTQEQPVVLVVEQDKGVLYRGDVTDAAKLAREPGVTTPGPARAFQYSLIISDIVSVNGKPAKGLQSSQGSMLIPHINPQPGQSIADLDGNGPYLCFWQFQGPDGSWIGSLWEGGAAPAPGHSILGGNGAFLGVTGEIRHTGWTAFRTASVTEDPANRRLHPSGKGGTVFHLWPKYRPAVDITTAGPAVFHGDLSPVTAASPARAGEMLIVRARNLGPTRPELLPPGDRVFKADPVEVVNSPIEVTVNGKDSEVINKIGWPGTSDLYRVDFRVPAGLSPGQATLRLTAAWIPGPEVKMPVQ